MQLKLDEVRAKDFEKKIFNKEYTDAEKKIKILEETQTYIEDLLIVINKINADNLQKDKTIKLLMIDNLKK